MKIKNIHWLSKEALEAEVIISDSLNELKCFAHPMKYKINESISSPLYAFEVLNVKRADKNEFVIINQGDAFEYFLTGKIIDRNNGLIRIGQFSLEIDSYCIPNDIKHEEFISFVCTRIDV